MSASTRVKATVRVGTSGWHYSHWRKLYYPVALKSSQWLGYYAREFAAVEVNSSFYRLPRATTVRRWLADVPESFVFALKASRRITHFKKLKNCADEVAMLLATAQAFGTRLGPVLFQLPPRWRCNVHRLAAFLEALPRGPRYVFEFRDASWHCEEVYASLRAHDVGFCVFDLHGETAPHQTTAPFAYVRLHGPRAAYGGSYRTATLRGWAGRVLAWKRRAKDVYVFFDNDERAYAARNARRLVTCLAELERESGKSAAA